MTCPLAVTAALAFKRDYLPRNYIYSAFSRPDSNFFIKIKRSVSLACFGIHTKIQNDQIVAQQSRRQTIAQYKADGCHRFSVCFHPKLSQTKKGNAHYSVSLRIPRCLSFILMLIVLLQRSSSSSFSRLCQTFWTSSSSSRASSSLAMLAIWSASPRAVVVAGTWATSAEMNS